jgi:hypothetical protein
VQIARQLEAETGFLHMTASERYATIADNTERKMEWTDLNLSKQRAKSHEWVPVVGPYAVPRSRGDGFWILATELEKFASPAMITRSCTAFSQGLLRSRSEVGGRSPISRERSRALIATRSMLCDGAKVETIRVKSSVEIVYNMRTTTGFCQALRLL